MLTLFVSLLLQPAPAWTTFRVGLYCGVFIVLMVTISITGSALITSLGGLRLFPNGHHKLG